MIPAGIVDPFTYIETGDRRAATVSVLDADKVARSASRSSTSTRSGATSC